MTPLIPFLHQIEVEERKHTATGQVTQVAGQVTGQVIPGSNGHQNGHQTD